MQLINSGRRGYVPYGRYSVIGHEVTCQNDECGQIMVPESSMDVDRLTHDGDSIITCPTCGMVSWHYMGVDDQVHSGLSIR